MPIVHPVCAIDALQKPDCKQRLDKRPFGSWPVDAKLDVFRYHPRQVAIRPVSCNPREQADQAPCAVRPCSLDELFRLRVRRQPDADAHIGCHIRPSTIARASSTEQATPEMPLKHNSEPTKPY